MTIYLNYHTILESKKDIVSHNSGISPKHIIIQVLNSFPFAPKHNILLYKSQVTFPLFQTLNS